MADGDQNTTPAAAPAAAVAPVAAPAPADASAPPAAPAAAAAPAPAAEPSAYTDFALPEGVKFNDTVLGEFKGIAAELKLDQAGAQKFVDIGAKMAKSIGEGQEAALKAEAVKWAEAAKLDKEIGGEKFEENLALANRVLGTFGSAELVDIMAKSGLSQHPEFIRAFHKIGKAVSEDKLVPAAKSANGLDPSDPRRIYNNPTSRHLA